jgi:hypothetical protein
MIRVYLSDPLVCIGRSDLYLAIQRITQGFFDRIAKRLPGGERIVVLFPPAPPDNVTVQDLIVYFTPTEFSVVARLTHETIDPLATRHWGLTASERPGITPQPGTAVKRASEVYPRMLDAEVLARLAFHECMHNKLRLGNEMHARGGLASASVGADTQLTEQNIADMAAAMKNPVPQWPEGFGILLDRRVRRDAGVDLWYL